jgi:hypothetical protein
VIGGNVGVIGDGHGAKVVVLAVGVKTAGQKEKREKDPIFHMYSVKLMPSVPNSREKLKKKSKSS